MSDVTVFYLQTGAASVSFLASALIILMITISSKKFSTSHRRIISALSFSDMIQSLALLTGPFLVERGTPRALWAVGTDATCSLNGFWMTVGTIGVPIYVFALSLRYVCKLNLLMSEYDFTHKVEKWIHLTVIVCVSALCFGALGSKSFNPGPSGSFCYLEEKPFGCSFMPEFVGECVRGETANFFVIVVVVIIIICFVGTVTNMSALTIKSIWIEKLFRSRAADPEFTQSNYSCIKDYLLCAPCKNYQQFPRETDADYVLRLYKTETIIQSSLYILGFFVSYILVVIQTIFSFYNIPVPYIRYGIAITYPLQGLFNILVYTRPAIVRLRHGYPDLSRVRALMLVLRNGGEMPNDTGDRLSYSCGRCCCRVDTEEGGERISDTSFNS
jgi:hypothetical protein